MATIADIERIAALVERLIPLSTRQRGELIDADEWNTVVGALLEVARTVISDEEEVGVEPHSHSDQVTSGWLDPVLRARLEKGPLADPASVARVAKLERSLDGMRLNLDGVKGDVTAVRTATGRLEAADLVRESLVTRVTRKVDGLGDARDEVTELRTSLGVLQTDLDRVGAFARDLDVGGETVTVASLVGRLDELDGLRERLTGPDGEELNATRFALRLAELENTLVTEEELNEALGSRPPGTSLPDDLRDELLAGARLVAREQVNESTSDLERRLSADISTRLQSVELAATRAAAARAEEISAELGSQMRDVLSARIDAGDEALSVNFTQALDTLDSDVRGVVDQRLAAMSTSVDTQLDSGLSAAGDALRAVLDERLTEIRGEVAPLSDRLGGVERDVVAATAGNDAVARQLGNEVRALQDSFGAQIEAAISTARANSLAADTGVAERLRAELAAERQRFDRALEGMQAQLPRLVLESIDTARRDLQTEFDNNITSLRNELTDVVRTGVNVGIAREFDNRGFIRERLNPGRILDPGRIEPLPPTDFERPR